MRRAKAISHLRGIIEACERDRVLHHDEPLVAELWATGFILDPGDLPGGVEVVFVLARPAEQLPSGVTPPVLHSFVAGHRLDNKPIVVYARPLGRPVCTVGLPRAARVWNADGADEDQLSALSDPASHSMDVATIADVDPSDLDQEREISRRFLVDAVAKYWDRDWRREHRGSRRTPELMLWEALRGYFQLTGDIDVE